MSDDLQRLTAAQLSAAYAGKSLSPVEVANAAIACIERVNPHINAIYHLDTTGALEAARQSEARWMQGESLSPLDGVPTTIKDALPAIGMPSFRGSAANDAHTDTEDHSAVARMREAGMVLLGKNAMCDYGIIASGVSSQHGVTRNPWNLTKTTGASSSGAAASVAAGIEPLCVGTDIVGSIRVPASYCGLFGLKPSYGRVPYYFPNSPAITAGPMARTVEDGALFLNLLARPDPRDHTALPYNGADYRAALRGYDMRGKRALLIPDIGFGLPLDPEVRQQVEEAARMLEQAGVTVETLAKAPFAKDAAQPAEMFYQARCLTEFAQRPEAQQDKSPVIRDWTAPQRNMSATQLYAAFNATQQLRAKAHALIEGFDFILMPSTPIPAHDAELPTPYGAGLFHPWCNTFLFNLTEQPAASIPCGFTEAGLPVGLQIIGQRYDDVGVLQMSHFYERLRGPMADWPDLAL